MFFHAESVGIKLISSAGTKIRFMKIYALISRSYEKFTLSQWLILQPNIITHTVYTEELAK